MQQYHALQSLILVQRKFRRDFRGSPPNTWTIIVNSVKSKGFRLTTYRRNLELADSTIDNSWWPKPVSLQSSNNKPVKHSRFAYSPGSSPKNYWNDRRRQYLDKLPVYVWWGKFDLNKNVNKQNCRIWSESNPEIIHETELHPERVTVWCAVSSRCIVEPYFFKENGVTVTVNRHRYLKMLNVLFF